MGALAADELCPAAGLQGHSLQARSDSRDGERRAQWRISGRKILREKAEINS